MHKIIVYGAYGWLTLAGTLHFAIDVVSQYLRGTRPKGPEAKLFYGMHTAYALSQILFGVFALLLAYRAPLLVDRGPVLVLGFVAALCWFVFLFVFIEYWEPKVLLAIYAILLAAAAVTV